MTRRYQRLLWKYSIVACSQCGYSGEIGIVEYVLEEHHIEGRHQGETVLPCHNCHAEITHKQYNGIRNVKAFARM